MMLQLDTKFTVTSQIVTHSNNTSQNQITINSKRKESVFSKKSAFKDLTDLNLSEEKSKSPKIAESKKIPLSSTEF